eukprot:365353-Chlamydomonas_euryale.AAC.9
MTCYAAQARLPLWLLLSNQRTPRIPGSFKSYPQPIPRSRLFSFDTPSRSPRPVTHVAGLSVVLLQTLTVPYIYCFICWVEVAGQHVPRSMVHFGQ